MWAIAGLGNPGSKYARTRHNVGFLVVSEFAEQCGLSWSDNFGGRVAKGAGMVLLKPMEFMNRSGFAVARMLSFYKIPVEQLIVVHDELDFEPGTIRIKEGGGLGGHNGLRSIEAQTGSKDFLRIRVGIGRPPGGNVTPWVLGKFSPSESEGLPADVETAISAAKAIVKDGVSDAMNFYNRKQ